jgi:hypothetical protein
MPWPALKPLFLTALVSLLPAYGRYERDGGWPRYKERPEREPGQLAGDFVKRIMLMAEDIDQHGKYFAPSDLQSLVKRADARSANLSTKADVIVTSPPYLNRHDYTRLFSPELSQLGFHSNKNLIRLRYGSFRSHVEARPGEASTQINSHTSRELSCLTEMIKANAYDGQRSADLVRGYFEDMYAFFLTCARHLRENGYLCIVISDVRHSGVMVSMPTILRPLAAQAGLDLVDSGWVRTRGNSSQQMDKFGRTPADEWVLLWRLRG